MADATGISKSTVYRVWTAFCIQPHRQNHFKLFTDRMLRAATNVSSLKAFVGDLREGLRRVS